MEKIWTIEDVADGSVILEKDTTIEDLQGILDTAFPRDLDDVRNLSLHKFNYFAKMPCDPTEWYFLTDEEFQEDQRPVVKVSELLAQVEEVKESVQERTAKSTATFQSITASLGELLAYKNSKYGNSALEPLNIFGNKSKVGQRLDDKLSRVQNSPDLRKNDVADIIGYLILVCQENNWTTFDEFKD